MKSLRGEHPTGSPHRAGQLGFLKARVEFFVISTPTTGVLSYFGNTNTAPRSGNECYGGGPGNESSSGDFSGERAGRHPAALSLHRQPSGDQGGDGNMR